MKSFSLEDLDLRLPRPPKLMVSAFLVFTVLTWLPLVFIARARTSKSSEPRVHLIQDMDNQPKYKEQASSVVFADGRSMRMPIPNTIARGHLDDLPDQSAADGDYYYRGYTIGTDGKPAFATEFPRQVVVDEALLERGRKFFNITCINCHGADGSGMGTAHLRAMEIGAGWTQPSMLYDKARRDLPVGHIYNVINNGIRNMGPQGHIVRNVDDRWAVVAYVRALQVARIEPATQPTTAPAGKTP